MSQHPHQYYVLLGATFGALLGLFMLAVDAVTR